MIVQTCACTTGFSRHVSWLLHINSLLRNELCHVLLNHTGQISFRLQFRLVFVYLLCSSGVHAASNLFGASSSLAATGGGGVGGGGMRGDGVQRKDKVSWPDMGSVEWMIAKEVRV